VLRRALLALEPERAHELALRALRLAPPLPVDEVLRVEALGRLHRTPLGVAAGFDKNAVAFAGLGRLGFGHVEVGTITPEPQGGNPRPRIFRVPAERALVNRMGFPNEGAEAVAARLRRRPEGLVVGANISKNRSVPLEQAAADCRAAARAVRGRCDYVVVNVSSPNTPGLRELQQSERLAAILAAVRAEVGQTPLLVKIAPDLLDAEIEEIASLALELRLDGIVAVNTTVAHDGPEGGLSGPPLRARALDVLARLRARVGDAVVLVSAGGVSDAGDVWERVRAGATLVQAYTGFVYGGPAWPARVNRELARIVREHGYARIQDAVGSVATTEN
jgi:dihydroorotate dehydrogenase